MRISIGACRRALSIMSWTEVGGIRLTVEGEERIITQVVAREGHWYSGDARLTRRQQEELTERAQAIIEDDLKRYQERFPAPASEDLDPGVPGGDRDCRGHLHDTPRRGEADHRSQDPWGREYAVVQRRASHDRDGTGQADPAGESHNRKASKRVRPELGLPRGA